MFSFIQRLFLVLFLSALAGSSQAQYSLTTASEPYASLSTGQRLTMRWADTVNPYSYVDLGGERFTFFGESFAPDATVPLGISKWGNLEFRNATSTIIIDPFHAATLDSLQPEATVRVALDGEPGDRVLKVEWQQLGFNVLPSAITATFQIWIYQRTGNIDFKYGRQDLECDPSVTTPQGPYVGILKATSDFSKIQKVFWLTGDPSAPSVSKISIRPLKCAPSMHTVYRLAASVAHVDEPLDSRTVPDRRATTELCVTEGADITIVTMNGRVALRSERTQGIVDVASMPRGLYLMHAVRNGVSETCKLLLE